MVSFQGGWQTKKNEGDEQYHRTTGTLSPSHYKTCNSCEAKIYTRDKNRRRRVRGLILSRLPLLLSWAIRLSCAGLHDQTESFRRHHVHALVLDDQQDSSQIRTDGRDSVWANLPGTF